MFHSRLSEIRRSTEDLEAEYLKAGFQQKRRLPAPRFLHVPLIEPFIRGDVRWRCGMHIHACAMLTRIPQILELGKVHLFPKSGSTNWNQEKWMQLCRNARG
jgi:hypothetical protein